MKKLEMLLCEVCEEELAEVDSMESSDFIQISSGPESNIWFGDVDAWFITEDFQGAYFCSLECFMKYFNDWYAAKAEEAEAIPHPCDRK